MALAFLREDFRHFIALARGASAARVFAEMSMTLKMSRLKRPITECRSHLTAKPICNHWCAA